jgi:hypothetical protein
MKQFISTALFTASVTLMTLALLNEREQLKVAQRDIAILQALRCDHRAQK